MPLYVFGGTLDDGSKYGCDIGSIGEETNVWRTFSAYDAWTNSNGVKNVTTKLASARADKVMPYFDSDFPFGGDQ